MKNPLLPAALAYIVGILLQELTPMPPLVAIIAALLFGTSTILLCMRKATCNVTLPMLLLFVASVATAYTAVLAQSYPANHVKNLVSAESQLVAMRGEIVEGPYFRHDVGNTRSGEDSGRTIFILKATGIRTSQGWAAVSGKVRTVVYGASDSRIAYGKQIELAGFLAAPKAATNPDQFDYSLMLQRRRIHAVLYSGVPQQIEVAPGTAGNSLKRWVYHVRTTLAETLETQFSPEHSSLLRCILLGDQQALDPAVREDFTRTGTYHFLVVSGLHMGALAYLLWSLQRLARVPVRAAAAFIIVAALFYMMLAGGRAPVVRATVFVCVLCGAKILNRSYSTLNVLALAALVVLVLDPMQLFSAGFQLSFAGVMGIVYLHRPVEGLLRRVAGMKRNETIAGQRQSSGAAIVNAALRGLSASIAACLAIAPLVAYYFNIIVPMSIVLNVLLFPVAVGILLLGSIFFLFSLVPALGSLAKMGLVVLLTVLRTPLAELRSLPWTTFFVGSPDPLWMICYYATLVASALHFSGHLKRRYVLVPAAAALLIVFVPFFAPSSAPFEAVFFDVGNGLSTYVHVPEEDLNLVFDCGTTSRFDVGQYLVGRHLLNRGVRRIDYLVLSHPHNDHINGVSALMERFSIRTLIVGPYFESFEQGWELLQEARKHRIAVHVVRRGDHLYLGRSCTVTFHERHHEKAPSKADNPNDFALALEINYGGNRLLLFSDDPQAVPDAVLAQEYDVVEIPHHGIDQEETLQLIENLKTRHAVISASGSYPHEQVVEGLRSKGMHILMTGEAGAVRALEHDGEVTIAPTRN